MNQRYRPGSRDGAWTKIRRRDTTEAIIGAITGPQLLILGRHDPTGRLRPIGRTVPLRPDAAAEHLTPASSGHPWAARNFPRHGAPATSWTPPRPARPRRRDQRRHSMDGGGVYRHPIRYVSPRLDASMEDVPRLGGGLATAAG
ncbi:hypothetical protein [Streptomyces sp. V1I6]|uniref:hypothetical protein n=1 Tax=Streptomyces sp. V1I6 TaxID=3042273 RepID=UPI0027D90D28|nr:hypothetical protein [Streptomyces sp. V1I6]